jgi:hypothetical protein
MLHYRISQKKKAEIHMTQNIAYTERLWTEIQDIARILRRVLASEDEKSGMCDTTTRRGDSDRLAG